MDSGDRGRLNAIGINRSFKVSGKDVEYVVYTSGLEPEERLGGVGDIYHHQGGDLYVKGMTGWSKGFDGETKHPIHTNGGTLVFSKGKGRWVVPGTMRGRKSRAILKDTVGSKRERSSSGGKDGNETFPEAKRGKTSSKAEEPEGNAPAEGHPENAWMIKLREEWGSAPLKFLPRYQDGKNMLDALVRYPSPIPMWDDLVDESEIYENQRPSMDHIMMDLLHTDDGSLNIIDQQLRFGCEVTKAQFLAALIRAPHVKEFNPSTRLYSIPDLDFHEEGSHQCGITVPKNMLDFSVQSTRDGRRLWGTSLCPLGTVTDVHTDYHGPMQLMLGISTRKLWLIWPGTPKNFEWWASRRSRCPTSTVTVEAIQQLEGLKILYQTGRQAFILPPYHFHAVMTFETSAHCGTALWDYEWWLKASKAGIEWEYGWARDYMANEHPRSEAVALLNDLDVAMGKWEQLLAKLVKKNVNVMKFKPWVKETSKKVKVLLNDLKG